MSIFKISVFFVSLINIISFQARASLTAEQIDVITMAEEARYKVRLLRKPGRQTVVLLGETHRVTEHRARVAEQVLNAFKLIGFEGINFGGPEAPPEQSFTTPVIPTPGSVPRETLVGTALDVVTLWPASLIWV